MLACLDNASSILFIITNNFFLEKATLKVLERVVSFCRNIKETLVVAVMKSGESGVEDTGGPQRDQCCVKQIPEIEVPFCGSLGLWDPSKPR